MPRFSTSAWWKFWTGLSFVVVAAMLFGNWPPSAEPRAAAEVLPPPATINLPAAAVPGVTNAVNAALAPKATPTPLPPTPTGPRPPLAGNAPAGRVDGSAPRSAAAVLYDQYNNAFTQGTNSQDYGPGGNANNVQVADDFVVPADQQWTVSQVDVAGAYINGPGPATAVTVQFFNHVNGTINPSPFISQTVSLVAGPNPGDFQLPLSPVVLDPGTYWLSVIAVENFSTNGQWIWLNRTIQSGQPALWRAAGGAFANRATSTNTPGAPDQVFRLNGASAPVCSVSHYDVIRTTGNTIVHATNLVTAPVLLSNNSDDDTGTLTPPFALKLYGTTYPTVTVSTNGNLQFLTANPQNVATPIPSPEFQAAIAPLWADLNPTGPLTTSVGVGVYTDTLGVAPNRRFVVEWITSYFNHEIPGGSVNFQVIFYENDPNRITTLYGRNDRGGVTTANEPIMIGIQNTNRTRFVAIDTTSPILPGTRIDYFDHTACAVGPTPTATQTPVSVVTGPSTPAGNFYPVAPIRVLDTRSPGASGNPNTPTGFDQNGNALTGSQSFNHTSTTTDITRVYRIGGKTFTFGGYTVTIPPGIRGILANVTVVQGTAGGGFVTVYSADLPSAPVVSTLNPQPGVAFNLTYTDVGRNGANVGNVAIRSAGDQLRDIIVDVLGYYQ